MNAPATLLSAQGLRHRPGGALVPGLRRLCDPEGGPQKTLADVQADPARTVFVSGIGCAARFPYYVETYGFHTIHGRAPGVRDRDQARQSRARRLGRRRRRRPALDRRQPSDPRAAAQPRPADPAVQQRDLRPDQGPVLAHLTPRHPLAEHAARLRRRAALGAEAGARRRCAVRRARHRHAAEAAARDPQACTRAQGCGPGRDPAELHRLQ